MKMVYLLLQTIKRSSTGLLFTVVLTLTAIQSVSADDIPNNKSWFFPEKPFSLTFGMNFLPSPTFLGHNLRAEYSFGDKIPFGIYTSLGPYFIPFPLKSTLYGVTKRKETTLLFHSGLFVNYPLHFLKCFEFNPQLEGNLFFFYFKGTVSNPVYDINRSYTTFHYYLQATFHPTLEWQFGNLTRVNWLKRFSIEGFGEFPIAHPLIIYDRFLYGANFKVRIVGK